MQFSALNAVMMLSDDFEVVAVKYGDGSDKLYHYLAARSLALEVDEHVIIPFKVQDPRTTHEGATKVRLAKVFSTDGNVEDLEIEDPDACMKVIIDRVSFHHFDRVWEYRTTNAQKVRNAKKTSLVQQLMGNIEMQPFKLLGKD